jgi:AraC-like DNA-binding protein
MEAEGKAKKWMFNPVFDWCTGMDVKYMETCILKHLDEKISPKSIIEHFGMDYQHARRRFYLYHGEYMTSYINRLRKERSMEITETVSEEKSRGSE